MGYNLLPVSTSLWKYTCVVLARAFGEFTWGRDTAIGCGLSVATIALQVHWGLISVTDWKQHTEQWIGSVVLPFVAVLIIHIAWRLVTAPCVDRAAIIHNLTFLNRNAFTITDTELSVIAALAMIGLSSRPKNG